MTFVVGSPCVGCKDTKCVTVCPVDCFHEGPNMLVINPDDCIDCGLCVPECPVSAIWSEDEVPAEEIEFIEINAKKAYEWPVRMSHKSMQFWPRPKYPSPTPKFP